MQYALINSTIYTNHQILTHHAVIIEQDRILQILPESDLPSQIKTIDLGGHNLTAGFIDLQLNGCGGVMFNEQITLETLETMQATNLKSGTTSFLPTFITSPDEGMKTAVTVMRSYLAKHKNQALGLHFEGPYISIEKKGVHQAQYIRSISDEMKTFLCDNAEVIRKITLAPENSTARYIPEFVQHGIIVSIGHSNATYEQTKKAIEQGASFATHLHNAMSHITSGRVMGVIGAILDSPIYAGIIIDGLHVNYANIRLDKKLKKDKLCIVTDATAAAGADIESFEFVGKKVYVRNGKCYDENGTIGGSAITMIASIQNAVEQVGITLDEALRMSNLYPARAIGVDHELGSIEARKVANLTVFSSDFQIKGVMVNGQWQTL